MTALATVLSHYGKSVSREKLKVLVPTTLQGTSLAALRDAAISVGFDASAGTVKRSSLPLLPVPFVAHLNTEAGGHFVTVYRVSPKHVELADPILGLQKCDIAEFDSRWSGAVLLLKPSGSWNLNAIQPPNMIAELWRTVSLRPTSLAILIMCLVATNISTVALSWMLGQYFNAILGTSHAAQYSALVSIFFVLFGRTVFSTVHALVSSRYGGWIEETIGTAYLNHLLTLPLSYFDNRRTGDIIARLYEVSRIRAACLSAVLSLALDVVLLLAALVWLCRSAAWASFTLLCFLSLTGVFIQVAAERTLSAYRSLQKDSGALQDILIGSLTNMRVIRSLWAEKTTSDNLLKSFKDYLRGRHKCEMALLRVNMPLTLLTALLFIATLGISSYSVSRGLLSPGALVTIYSLSAMVFASVERATPSLALLEEASVSADALFDTLALESEVSLADPPPPVSTPTQLVVSHVSAGPKKDVSILNDCSFALRPGELVCLLGASGSGKSTLACVVAGLLPPSLGNISLLGPSEVLTDAFSLRKHVTLVMQEPGITSGSIRQNLLLGLPHTSDQKLYEASRMAQAHEFIMAKERGYDTEVGSHGCLLSTGQRQRLALARALLRNSSILILDEATSGLDPLTEEVILSEIQQSRRKLSTLLITHRVVTALRADRCLVIDNGCIVEDGSPSTLLSRESWLRALLDAAGVKPSERSIR